MPCQKVTMKNTSCNKDACICKPPRGASRICHCQNETSDTSRCDCKRDGNECECKTNCTCVSTAGFTCTCVCRETGRIKTRGDCSCKPAQASCKGKCNDSKTKCSCETGNEKFKCPEKMLEDSRKVKCCRGACGGNCRCKGNASSCICICKNKNGKNTCCDDCNCDDDNTCDKEGCTCVPKKSSTCSTVLSCYEGCKCSGKILEDARKVNTCSGGACNGNCKCQGNENSCICICKNKRVKTACCDDCKCDVNNKCDKEGCACVPKKSLTCSTVLGCDEGCKCSGKMLEDARKVECSRGACGGNCRCQGDASSCICICKNKNGKNTCCDDCNCDDDNTCDKEGCTCVSKESLTCSTVLSCDEGCNCSGKMLENALKVNKCSGEACGGKCKCQGDENSCICTCKNEKGEAACCDDCKCDVNNKCEKTRCACVSEKGFTCSKVTGLKNNCYCKTTNNCCSNCEEGCKCSSETQDVCKATSCGANCKCQGNARSCICVCKNNQGETICCDDCKCDENYICDKTGCGCVPKNSFSCVCKYAKAGGGKQ